MKMATADGSILIKTGVDTSGVKKGTNTIKSSLGGLSSTITKLGAAIGIAFGINAIIQFSKASIKASNEIENAMQGLKSIVEGQGRSFEKSKAFIDDYISDGLIPATDAVTAYKNLAMRGYTDVQIEQTLIALKDSAAYGRQASLSMGQAVSSATEGLKNENSILVDNAGVTKNVSMMWKDYAKSIGVGVDSLTKQQKIQAEVIGIMEETRFQTGDAAKVADTYSGSILKLQFGLNNAKIAFGNFIKPIMTVVIPVINTAIAAFTRFFNTLAAISTALFGTRKSNAEQAKEQSNAVGDTVKNETALGKAADKTNKKLKDQTSGLDEINILSKEAAEGAGEIVPDVGADLGDVDTNIDFSADIDTSSIDELIKKFEAFGKSLEPVKHSLSLLWDELKRFGSFAFDGLTDFYNLFLKPVGEWALGEAFPRFVDAITKGLALVNWESVNASLQTLWKSLTPFAINVGEGLLWLWENVLVPFGTWTANNVVPLFLDGLSAIIGILNGVLEALKPLGIWLWDNFLKPIAEWTGGITASILSDIVAALTDVSDWIDDNKHTIEATTIAVGAFFALWSATSIAEFIINAGGLSGLFLTLSINVYKSVTALLAHAVAIISNKVETLLLIGLYAKDFVLAIGKSIVEFGRSTAALIVNSAQWVWNKVCLVASAVAQGAMTIATTAWNIICAIATGVTTAFGVAVAFLTSPIGLIIIAIVALIAIVVLLVKNWDTVKEVAAKVWDSIVKVWGNFAKWFDEKVWTPFMKGLKAVGNFFIGIWNNIINAFESAVNWIIGGINSIIGAINGMLDFGGDLLKKVGINIDLNVPTIPNVSFGRIPALARGAVIPPNKQFMAILGDQRHGTNIEAPLDTILQAFRAENANNLNNSLLEKMIGLLEVLVSKETTLEIDGQTLGRTVDTYQQNKGANISKGAFANAY